MDLYELVRGPLAWVALLVFLLGSLAMLDVNIWYPSVMIGVITSAMSLGAIFLGKRLGTLFGKRMEILGGLILIGIGIRILASELMAGG